MEFSEKLQTLRKKKGLTQEELAASLYVSRTAVSKWESGRGYPSIESLKQIAVFFSVTVDALLSGEEVLAIAEEDTKQKAWLFCDLIFGSLDIAVLLFLFLPLFGQRTDGMIQTVSLLSLSEVSAVLRILYFAVSLSIVVTGFLRLALQSMHKEIWKRIKNKVSLFLSAAGVLLFIISPQPYAAATLFVFLIIKAICVLKTK